MLKGAKKIFILKVGTTFPDTLEKYGDFDLWTIRGLGVSNEKVSVVDIEHGDILPPFELCGGVIITGSHSMVTDNLGWSVKIANWIPAIIDAEIPFLGICYGHQLLAQAMGGEVGFHSKGKEIGTVDIHLLPDREDDLLFKSLPVNILAHVIHAQTVLSLPPTAVRLAKNQFEKNHAFRIGKCAWGVQFHPEYNASIMRSYILNQEADLRSTGKNIDEILSDVRETPLANGLLQKFGKLVIGASILPK